jgi:hypothetical protein
MTVLVLNLGQLSPLSQLSPAKLYHPAACPMGSYERTRLVHKADCFRRNLGSLAHSPELACYKAVPARQAT